jgi:hypothetical protein
MITKVILSKHTNEPKPRVQKCSFRTSKTPSKVDTYSKHKNRLSGLSALDISGIVQSYVALALSLKYRANLHKDTHLPRGVPDHSR